MARFVHPPLKRHDALLPLSHDHHQALFDAKQLRLAARSTSTEKHRAAARAYLEAWDDHLREHLDAEEAHLSPALTQEEDERMLREHRRLKSAAQELRDALAEQPQQQTDPQQHQSNLRPLLTNLAKSLHDHIRWEERELFTALQNRRDGHALAAIDEALRQRTEERGQSCPRRD